MTARGIAKQCAFGAATVLVAPALLSFQLRARLMGTHRALEGSTQALASVPGVFGQYLRRAFLCRTLAFCHPSAVIEFGTIFSHADARIDEHVYIGAGCQIGLAHIGPGALIAGAVRIPSGGRTHGIAAGIPVRLQSMTRVPVAIGADSWVGTGAIVMADVGRSAVVGAGAVVTRPVPDGVVVAGIPARCIRRKM